MKGGIIHWCSRAISERPCCARGISWILVTVLNFTTWHKLFVILSQQQVFLKMKPSLRFPILHLWRYGSFVISISWRYLWLTSCQGYIEPLPKDIRDAIDAKYALVILLQTAPLTADSSINFWRSGTGSSALRCRGVHRPNTGVSFLPQRRLFFYSLLWIAETRFPRIEKL